MVKRGGPNGRPYNPPWPLAPQPFCPLFDCCVVVVWDQAVRLHSATWSQNRCALTPPGQKNQQKSPHKTEAVTPYPGRSSPRPRIRSLIVVLLTSAIGRYGLICPPHPKMQYLSTPPPKKKTKIPLIKRSGHTIPQLFHPPPLRMLVDCGIVEVGDRAVRSNLPARSQITTSIFPPPRPKIRQKSPSKKEGATPSPGRSSPRPRVRSLIVVLLRSATGRCGLIRPPGRKLRPLSYPPPSRKMLPKSPSKNEVATPSPGRFRPRQRGRQLIVMSLGCGIKRNSRNRPPIAIRPGYQTPRLPRFCPNCVAAGLTLRLTRTSYRKSGVANEAQGNGLSGDASSSL